MRDADDDALLDLVDGLVGTGVATQEAVPAAFAVASRAPDDPWRAALLAARLGGDSDTVAAMAGAMVGACTGLGALPGDAVEQVRRVNDLQLEHVVEDLLALREHGRLGVTPVTPAARAGQHRRRPGAARRPAAGARR